MGTFGLGGLHRKSTWLYPVPTFGDLPVSCVDGSVVVVKDTNLLYQCDAGVWIPVGGGGSGSINSHWDPVRVTSVGNIVLSGEQVIDGVLTSADRVLVNGQAVPADNGIYVSDAGAWVRSTDADTDAEILAAKLVSVSEGTAYSDSLWILTTNNPITVGATGLSFAEIKSATGGSNAHWDPARVATTGNITLSGEQVIDGVLTSAYRVLVKNQTTASENGIYVSDAGAWVRAVDADADPEVVGAKMVSVSEGTAHGDTLWQLTTNDPITVGVTGLTFTENQSTGGGGGGGGSTVTLGYRGVIPASTTFQYLSVWGPTASSDVGFTPMAASTLIGCSITVNLAHPTNTYTLEIMEDPTGRQGTGPLVLGSIVLSPTDRNNERRNLSVAIGLGVEIGARVRRTGGSGNSNPIKSIIGALEYTTP
jgi:phage-related tail fiber protein